MTAPALGPAARPSGGPTLGLVRAELLRLRTTRSTWLLLAAAAVLPLLQMTRVLLSAGSIEGASGGSASQRDALLTSVGITALLLPMLYGVLLLTGEVASRSLTATLLVTPVRRRVVVGKVLAAAVAGASVGLACVALGVLATAAAGSAATLQDGSLAPLLGGIVLMAACSGVLGVGIGTVVPSPTAAVAVPVLWFIGVETLLTGFRSSLGWLLPWLPGSALAVVSGGSTPGSLPWPVALAVVALYVLALLVPGTRALVRADVG